MHVEDVALGSEFDGATMPDACDTARQVPALIDMLGGGGYTGACWR